MDAHNDSGLAPHVVVRVGAARIGIPADCVQRALSAPEQFAPPPRRHGALLGVRLWTASLSPLSTSPAGSRWTLQHQLPAQPTTPTRRRHQRGAVTNAALVTNAAPTPTPAPLLLRPASAV
jgi:hypothetical protein